MGSELLLDYGRTDTQQRLITGISVIKEYKILRRYSFWVPSLKLGTQNEYLFSILYSLITEMPVCIHSVPRVVLTFRISNLGKIYIFRTLMA